jgi:hypothetical protein
MSAPVNANDPPPDAPPVVDPPVVLAPVTTIANDAVVPLVDPVATIVWLPGVVLAGMVTVVVNAPCGFAVVVPSVTGVLKSWIVMVSPG